MLVLLATIIVSVVSISCPDTISSCSLNCSSPACVGALNCSTNTDCSLSCTDDQSCSSVQVTGVSNGLSNFAVDCQGDHSCQNAIFNAKPAALTRFGCSGNYSCVGASFNCGTNNCELVCDEANACQGISMLQCAGGPGKTCTVACSNGGCDSSLKVVCANYPCNVSITGSGSTSPCSSGQLLCADRSCVSPGTACPSQCLNGDPCNTAHGNACKDVGAVGGPYNCTCTIPGYTGTAVGNLVQSCSQVVGYGTSMTISTTPTSSGKVCGGKSQRAVTWPAGCNVAVIGGDGVTKKYTSCTANLWCQSDCGSTCVPSQPVAQCINNVRVTCNNIFNDAATSSAQAAFLVIFLASFFQ